MTLSTHGMTVEEGPAPDKTYFLTNGQLMIGSTGADPVPAALTAGAGIAVTNGAGSISLAATSAAAGGYVSQTQASPVTLTSGQFNDVTSISLPAGTWDISGVIRFSGGAITGTLFEAFFGTVAGNNSTGQDVNVNTTSLPTAPTTASDITIRMPTVRVTLVSTTIYYLKAMGTFSVGTATAAGSMRAVKIA